MSTTITETACSFQKLEVRGPYGNFFRTVSTAEPREATIDEIPIIDISGLYGGVEERRELAASITAAVTGYGFFYIKNHGISKDIIQAAEKQAKTFFNQPEDRKQLVDMKLSKHFNGWTRPHTRRVSPGESADNKEGFSWKYAPEYDPETKDLTEIPQEVKPYLRGEDFVWEGTAHIPNFKEDVITYWQACLSLSRRLIRIFAIALNLPEDHFDPVTTYPGSDGVFNFYPGMKANEVKTSYDVGLGSHTDLQCFTILWQDTIGGLQVLSDDGQWIKAGPIADTFVVNIGDFLMRLSNDRFKSNVHRVYNRTHEDRLSMPFFFGFNFNETLSVLPTCISEKNPAKYDPISCGEYCHMRFKLNDESKKL